MILRDAFIDYLGRVHDRTGCVALLIPPEHEAHHRGQLYSMLALRAVPTPPLSGLTSEEVRARSR